MWKGTMKLHRLTFLSALCSAALGTGLTSKAHAWTCESQCQWYQPDCLVYVAACEVATNACFAAAGAASEQVRLANGPGQPLTQFQKLRLRVFHGDLVDRVTIHYNALLAGELSIDRHALRWGVGAQTFGHNIYVAGPFDEMANSQLGLLGHELKHVEQFERDADNGINFLQGYCRGWVDSGFSYENNVYEAEAFAFEAFIDQELAKGLPPPAPEWYVLSGDWDGNGTKTPGLYNARTHRWLLSNHNSGGGVDHDFGWGGGTQIPVVGDWDGNGTDTPGLYDPQTHAWTLSNHNSGGGVDAQFGWGGGIQVPLAGDWNGDGIDTPGLYNPQTHVWTLSNHNSGGGVDAQFGWGGGALIPIVGDWNGDGVDTPGLYDPANHVWTLSNHNSGGGVDAQFGWGGGAQLPVVGDWDGNGTDTPGLYLGGKFTLSNVNAGGGVAADFDWGPVGDYTVAGAP